MFLLNSATYSRKPAVWKISIHPMFLLNEEGFLNYEGASQLNKTQVSIKR